MKAIVLGHLRHCLSQQRTSLPLFPTSIVVIPWRKPTMTRPTTLTLGDKGTLKRSEVELRYPPRRQVKGQLILTAFSILVRESTFATVKHEAISMRLTGFFGYKGSNLGQHPSLISALVLSSPSRGIFYSVLLHRSPSLSRTVTISSKRAFLTFLNRARVERYFAPISIMCIQFYLY